jgi:hypothetical protein
MAAGLSPSMEPKVTCPSIQRIPQAAVPSQTNHGIINGGVTVRVVFTQYLTDDTGRFLVGLAVAQTELQHTAYSTRR